MLVIKGFFSECEEYRKSINMQEFKKSCILSDNFNNLPTGSTLKKLIANKDNKKCLRARVDFDEYVGVFFGRF